MLVVLVLKVSVVCSGLLWSLTIAVQEKAHTCLSRGSDSVYMFDSSFFASELYICKVSLDSVFYIVSIVCSCFFESLFQLEVSDVEYFRHKGFTEGWSRVFSLKPLSTEGPALEIWTIVLALCIFMYRIHRHPENFAMKSSMSSVCNNLELDIKEAVV